MTNYEVCFSAISAVTTGDAAKDIIIKTTMRFYVAGPITWDHLPDYLRSRDPELQHAICTSTEDIFFQVTFRQKNYGRTLVLLPTLPINNLCSFSLSRVRTFSGIRDQGRGQ